MNDENELVETIAQVGRVSAYLDAVAHGFQGTRAEFGEYLAHCAEWGADAQQAAENAEAWATGKRGGEDVPETDPTYHNNAEYFAGEAAESETAAAGYCNEAGDYAEAANGSKVAAAASALAAEESASTAATFIGAPLTASTAAGMTDQTRIYVYTGSESGYVNGDWYFWNGTAWDDGGTYMSAVVDIASAQDLQDALYS